MASDNYLEFRMKRNQLRGMKPARLRYLLEQGGFDHGACCYADPETTPDARPIDYHYDPHTDECVWRQEKG